MRGVFDLGPSHFAETCLGSASQRFLVHALVQSGHVARAVRACSVRRAYTLALVLGATLGLVVLANTAPDARAGTFKVVVCGDAPGFAVRSWLATNSQNDTLEVGQACG